MILLNRWKFFSNKGYELNLERIPKIIVEIKNSVGSGALFQPITDNLGNLIALEIIEPGIGFNISGTTNIDIVDENGTVYNIPTSELTFNSSGGFQSFDVTSLTTPPPVGVFTYPSFTLEGNIFFDSISTGLIENENIFIIEEARAADGKVNYIFPRYNSINANIQWKWTNEDTLQQDKDAFFIFDVDTVTESTPFIEKIEVANFQLGNGPSPSFNIPSSKYIRTFSGNDANSIQLNLGTSYPTEGIFERKLELYDTNNSESILIAEIYLRSEIIPEDERFLTILDNLGQKINAEEEFIFRDSDINEDLVDNELLNRKRKEFILEHSNIIPYIGSYKAVFNVINWLGYDDLRLKEYWLNINEGSVNYNKYKSIDVPFSLKQKGRDVQSSQLLPSNIYKKTSLFGLYYDINRESGEVDTFGIPITEDAFMFTNEEVLIKLHALKNYLKQKFLPLNARIIDIIGEGVYFERYRVNSWKDGTKIFQIANAREAKFSCTPHVSTVIDLRELENFEKFKPAKLLAFLNNNNKVGAIIQDGGFGYITPTGGTGVLPIEFIGGNPQILDPFVDFLPSFNANIINGVVVSINPIIIGCDYVSTPLANVVPDSTNPNQTTTILSYIGNRILGSFSNKLNTKNLPDKSNLPVGAPILLETSTFDITWNELVYPWDDFYYDFQSAEFEAIISGGVLTSINIITGGIGYTSPPIINIQGGSPVTDAILGLPILSGGSIVSVPIINGGIGYVGVPVISSSGGFPVSQLNNWDTIGIGEFYELEWIITGPQQFIHRKRGRSDDLKDYALTVPFQGIYTVELILYGTDNNRVNEIKEKCFEVVLPEPTFTAHGRFTECRDTWNELNFTWNEANFMWIHLVKHETKWEDLNTTWDSFEMSTYADQNVNQFPPIVKREILTVSETDRFLGNLVEIDKITQTLTVNNASIQPPVVANDFIYLKRNDNIFRTQVTSSSYGFALNSVDIISGGSNYAIDFNFSIGSYVDHPRPTVIVDAPIFGDQAIAIVVLDGSINLPSLYLQNAGVDLVSAIDSTNSIVPAIPTVPPVVLLPGQFTYNFVCTSPENGNNFAFGFAILDNLNDSIQQLVFTNIGSGYNNVPNIILIDNNGNVVISSTNQPPLFWLRIQGAISSIQLLNPGSGYTTIPNVVIQTPILPGSPATASASFDFSQPVGTFIVSTLPLGLTISWSILREIGPTVVANGDVIFNEITNVSGLRIGDYVTLCGEDNVPKIRRIPVINEIQNFLGADNGISVGPGDYASQFRTGEKCKIYKDRSLFFGIGSDEWEVFADINDLDNEGNPKLKIQIWNPTFNLIDEIIPGFHVITVINRDNNFVPAVVTYVQRFLVEHIEIDTSYVLLEVAPLDGDISQINAFNSPSQTEINYKYWEFPAVIVSAVYNGTDTEVILNFNDWPTHENFAPTINDWYFDYGIVSGDYSLEVINIGFQGNDTLITLDDPNSELWRLSTSFGLAWRVFDEDYAKTRWGSDNLDWKDLDELSWENSCAFTWDMMEYHPYTYSGFKILEVQPGGGIQWNEEPVFEFTGILGVMTTDQKLIQAVMELNQTDNSGLSRFNYVLMPDSINPTYIMAVAKDPGGENIGYLRFNNGVVGEWVDPTLSHSFPLGNTVNQLWLNGFYGPDNKPANWNPLIRAYNEWGVDPAGDYGWYPTDRLPSKYDSTQRREESLRIPYLRSASSAFTWEETFVSLRNIDIPINTVVFFRADGSVIAGKTQYLWRIIDSKGIILTEIIKPYLIWVFSSEDNYDIELTITDTNRNSKTIKRIGFVKTYQPKNVETNILTPL